jgi:lysophospholipase L1-like esterase
MMIPDQSTVLFQGDSITDAGRDRNQTGPNGGLGGGYPLFIAGASLSKRPCAGLSFLNRGISGNRIVDLYARWKSDCLNLHPDFLSILVGVNDTWHEQQFQNGVEPARFEQIYRLLLEWTRRERPRLRLILCEPFVLPCGHVTSEWTREMKIRQEIVRQLAADFDACFVPFQSMFDQCRNEAPAEYWARDGVHPTLPGHLRMAELWQKSVGAIEGQG